MSQIDENGLIVDRYDDIFQKIVTDLKSVWGEGIRSDAQSVTGQFLAIFSEAIADQNELIEAVANIFDPNSTIGVFLSELVKLNGLTRKEKLYSTTTLRCSAHPTQGTTIPAGSEVSDPEVGKRFRTDVQITVAAGATGDVSATAKETGPIAAPAGTLTKIETSVFGWDSVTNLTDAAEGRDEESDTELRIRRNDAATKTGTATVTAIRAALLDVEGVDMVEIQANNTQATVGDVPPQHIRVVVNGGSDGDLAEALFGTVAAGIGYHGSTSYVYTEEQSGDQFTIKWDRPSEVSVYIIVNLTVDSAYPGDGDALIKGDLVTYFEENLFLGDTVIHSRLYTPINETPGHTVDSLYIGTSPSPTQEDDIPMDIDQIARTDDTIIIINKA
jgi:uncharacterized phage protein gp47/JayE